MRPAQPLPWPALARSRSRSAWQRQVDASQQSRGARLPTLRGRPLLRGRRPIPLRRQPHRAGPRVVPRTDSVGAARRSTGRRRQHVHAPARARAVRAAERRRPRSLGTRALAERARRPERRRRPHGREVGAAGFRLAVDVVARPRCRPPLVRLHRACGVLAAASCRLRPPRRCPEALHCKPATSAPSSRDAQRTGRVWTLTPPASTHATTRAAVSPAPSLTVADVTTR